MYVYFLAAILIILLKLSAFFNSDFFNFDFSFIYLYHILSWKVHLIQFLIHCSLHILLIVKTQYLMVQLKVLNQMMFNKGLQKHLLILFFITFIIL